VRVSCIDRDNAMGECAEGIHLSNTNTKNCIKRKRKEEGMTNMEHKRTSQRREVEKKKKKRGVNHATSVDYTRLEHVCAECGVVLREVEKVMLGGGGGA